MSGPIRCERRSPVPCPETNDANRPELPARPSRTERADWLLLLPIAPGAVALDLGCGRGALSLDLAQYCDRVVAVDPVRECVSATQIAAARAGVTNIRATCMEMDALLAANRRYDLIVVQDLRRLFPRRRAAAAVRTLARLVRPNGCVAVAAGIPPRSPGDGPGGERTGYRGAGVPYWGDYGAGHLRRLFVRSGLPEVQVLAAAPDAYTADCLFPVAGRMRAGPHGRAVSRCLWPVASWREGLLRVAAGLSLWGAARVLAPAFWIIARAPGSLRAAAVEEMVRSIAARPALPAVRHTDPLERARVALRARPLSFVVSREHAGPEDCSAVAALPAGWHEPACVLRVQRRRGGEPRIAASQADLFRLRARLTGRMRESVPVPLGTAEVGDHHATAEAYVPGVTLLRAIEGAGASGGRRTVQRDLPVIAHWLADLHEQTCTCAWIEGDEAVPVTRRAAGPVVFDAPGAVGRLALLDETLQAIARAGTRLGAAHNRLVPGRVIVRAGGVTVTGWDRVSFESLPLLDLLCLVHSLGILLLPARRRSGADAFAFTFEEDTWYHEQVRRTVDTYCGRLGLDPRMVSRYLALSFVRGMPVDPGGADGNPMPNLCLAERALHTDWDP